MAPRRDRPAGTLRPIEPWEHEYLERLGDRIRELRYDAGMTQKALAHATGLNPASLRRIELGYRRTRESTLRRIVSGLFVQPMESDVIVRELLELAGPALAAESSYR